MELFEAFKALDALNEDTFSVSDDGIEKLDAFQSDDESEEFIDVIDTDAETPEDFEDSYLGKVILDCTVCHSKIYKDKEDVDLNEDETLANVGEECPFCFTSDGFKIIGEVANFDSSEKEESSDDIEVKELDVEEKDSKKLHESKSIKEGSSKDYNPVDTVNIAVDNVIDNFISSELGNLALEISSLNRGYDADMCSDDSNSATSKAVDKAIHDLRKAIKADLLANYSKNESKSINESDIKSAFANNIDQDIISALGSEIPKKPILGGMVKCSKSAPLNALYYVSQGEEVKFNLGNIKLPMRQITHCWVEHNGEVAQTGNDGLDLITKFSVDLVPNDVEKSKQLIIDEINKINGLNESKSINEDINNLSLDTDDTHMEMTSDDEGKVTITTEPIEKEVSTEEVLAPVSPRTESEIKDSEVDVELDEFDEESFDELGESYLKEVYSNVESFKTSDIESEGNKLKLEGIVKFTSGAEKKTSFIFEAKDCTRSGKYRFIGENVNLTKGKKAFSLTGKLEGKKFISESLRYDYNDRKGASARRYGTVRRG